MDVYVVLHVDYGAGGSRAMKRKKGSKYRNVRTEVDGMIFDSKKEADRWCVLRALERDGQISDLCRQVSIELKGANGIDLKTPTGRKMVYRADFMYDDCSSGELVIEDVKGKPTELYRLKKEILRAMGVYIREV